MTSDADSGSADYGGIELDVLQCLCLGLAGQFAACSIDDEDCHSLGLQLAAGSAFDGSGRAKAPQHHLQAKPHGHMVASHL